MAIDLEHEVEEILAAQALQDRTPCAHCGAWACAHNPIDDMLDDCPGYEPVPCTCSSIHAAPSTDCPRYREHTRTGR